MFIPPSRRADAIAKPVGVGVGATSQPGFGTGWQVPHRIGSSCQSYGQGFLCGLGSDVACAYCGRRVGDWAHLAQPGVPARILPPSEVPSLVRQTLLAEPRLRVIGVAGPGEPLANPETFEALALAREAWKRMARGRGAGDCGDGGAGSEMPGEPILRVSTNGLLLEEKAPELARLGVRTVSVSVNAVSPAVGAHIYLDVKPDPAPAELGELGAAFLVRRQLAGIRRVVVAGLTVKVNTVLIPGVNFEGRGRWRRGRRDRDSLRTVWWRGPCPGRGHPSTTSYP